MRKLAQFFGVLALLGIVTLLVHTAPALADPNIPTAEIGSLKNPVPVGKAISLVDDQARLFKVGISEVVRGPAAWRRVQRADPLNLPPAAGQEYLMAFVVVRNLSGAAGTESGLFNFKTYTANQTLDETQAISGVRPDFRVEDAQDMPGGGWIVREVYASDPAPLLLISLRDSTDDGTYFSTTEDN